MATIKVEQTEYKIEGPVTVEFKQGTCTHVEVCVPYVNDFLSIESSGLHYAKTRNGCPAPAFLVVVYLPQQGNRYVRFIFDGIDSVIVQGRAKKCMIISEMISLSFVNLSKDIYLHHLSVYSIELSGNKFVSIEECEIISTLSCLNSRDVYMNKVWTHDLVVYAIHSHVFLGMCRFVAARVTCEHFTFYGIEKRRSATLILHVTLERSRVFLSKLHCNFVSVSHQYQPGQQRLRLFDCVIKKRKGF